MIEVGQWITLTGVYLRLNPSNRPYQILLDGPNGKNTIIRDFFSWQLYYLKLPKINERIITIPYKVIANKDDSKICLSVWHRGNRFCNFIYPDEVSYQIVPYRRVTFD